ncbi:MAG: hypothetical protein JKY55_06510 [Aliivibrio sp.]|uniref:hypothetical protein n=1 Tax=Aliivibrio sp. TaxID=1872443 RepID=UPI001A39F6F8|nr:hypothetical protein [Aliivibrio sp.]
MPNVKVYGLDQNHFLDQFNDDQVFKIVTDAELRRPLFRLDGINSVRDTINTLPHRKCLDFFIDKYRDLPGYFADENGNEVFLNTDSVLDCPDEWWRDSLKSPKPRTTAIILRAENTERFRVILSLYRAYFPERAMLWGVRSSNDNVAHKSNALP